MLVLQPSECYKFTPTFFTCMEKALWDVEQVSYDDKGCQNTSRHSGQIHCELTGGCLAVVEKGTESRGAVHLQFFKPKLKQNTQQTNKKGRKAEDLEIAPGKWRPVLNLHMADGHSLTSLLTQYQVLCYLSLVAVSVAVYILNGASLSMFSFWRLKKLVMIMTSVFFLQLSCGWWV